MRFIDIIRYAARLCGPPWICRC